MASDPIFTANRTAVIVGSASGIGRAAAEHCAGLGMKVLMADWNAEALEAAADDIRKTSKAKIVTQQVDVSDFAAVAALKPRAFVELGDVALVMNNAGIGPASSAYGGLDTWRQIFDVNLWGIVHGVQAFTQPLIDQGRPARIVNTGSKQGITNPPGNPAYNATKAAVKSLTESLQHALRNVESCDVSAHLLIPGFTFTGLTRQRVSEKPPAAWTPEQVVQEMVRVVGEGGFYILCPDNETTSEMDAKRVLWGAQDLTQRRSALSRWDARFKAEFDAYMTQTP